MKRPPPPPVPTDREILEPTPAPARGVISWNMNTSCNYRCSYCTQRFMDDRGRWARDVPRFIEAFGRLPGPWEVKMSGGEPFVHPQFLEIVTALAALEFRISVVTNFSAKRSTLEAFVDAAGPHLGVVSCSLHLEYVSITDDPAARDTLSDFIARAQWVQSRLPSTGSVCVTCVATRTNLPTLAALRARFDAAGLVFKVQPHKRDREVIEYAPHERQQLVQLGGHNLTGSIAPDFGGQPCWAGSKYFIVDDRGLAFRCYPARRYRVERMGNLLDDGFALADGPTPCRYRYCNCTVPISRGMMPRPAAHDAALARP
ncbi:MAG: radical SAM protein [Deltaproteobacteria bacterium]|nr:radical SAM protein [Deltaproteobacteria bacterium]